MRRKTKETPCFDRGSLYKRRPPGFMVELLGSASRQHTGPRDLSTPRRDSQANPFTPLKMTGVKGQSIVPAGKPICERSPDEFSSGERTSRINDPPRGFCRPSGTWFSGFELTPDSRPVLLYAAPPGLVSGSLRRCVIDVLVQRFSLQIGVPAGQVAAALGEQVPRFAVTFVAVTLLLHRRRDGA